MAAYHFTAKIHSRGKGASAVRAAAYRAAERLVDERLGVTEDYTRKADVARSAILSPEGAPTWMSDRSALWNAVEKRERRKDAQVAQELEINLPRELTEEENWQLAVSFAEQYLTAEGRICDLAMHIHEAADGSSHPHLHILMPCRSIAGDRFGDKHPDCSWKQFLDRRDRLGELREVWADYARDYAARLGYDLGPDWDHRSFEDRRIDLEAQPKLGATAQRRESEGLPAERTEEILAAQRRNGERLLSDPMIVLEALTQRQSTYTETDLAKWIHRHAADDQFADILAAAKGRSVLVGTDERDRERYSTPEMLKVERTMILDAAELADRQGHRVAPVAIDAALGGSRLSDEQRQAARDIFAAGDVACLIGRAGAGKSTMLEQVRLGLEAQGYTVRGAALSGIAAKNLQKESGIAARTIYSFKYAWDKDRDHLDRNTVLIVDEAGMVGSRDLALLIGKAKEAGAKVVLVGDPEQLQAIEAGAAFRAIAERTGAGELTEVRRQHQEWQRVATRELATGETAEALDRYRAAGAIRVTETEDQARALLVKAWQQDRRAKPNHSRIMLAHTRADVRKLNDAARLKMREAGELGADVTIATTKGERAFATGDRLLFLKNDRSLDVKNGTLGTVIEITPCRIAVRSDEGRLIEVDPRAYRDLDHGNAVTIHKSQGVTVDAAHVLASRGMDRHLAYVAMSRHRHDLTIVHSEAAFVNSRDLATTLGRERAKDTTLDYWEAPLPVTPTKPELTLSPPMTALERAYIEKQAKAPSLADAFKLHIDQGPRLRR